MLYLQILALKMLFLDIHHEETLFLVINLFIEDMVNSMGADFWELMGCAGECAILHWEL